MCLKLWNSFRILSIVSMKYCSMRKKENDRVCITKRPRKIWQHLTCFWIKKNVILRLFECFQLSESTACCQKSRCDRVVALCMLWRKDLPSYPYRCKDVNIPLFGWNSTLFDIYTRFFIYQRHHHRLDSIYILNNHHIYRDMQIQYLEKVHHYIIVLTLLVEQLLVFVDRF